MFAYATGWLSCFITFSPHRATRNKVRSLVGDAFVEVFIKCPLEVCEQRDPKGLYRKARAGEVKHFTGIDSPYEEPIDPEVIVETNELSVNSCVSRIMDYVALQTSK